MNDLNEMKKINISLFQVSNKTRENLRSKNTFDEKQRFNFMPFDFEASNKTISSVRFTLNLTLTSNVSRRNKSFREKEREKRTAYSI